VFPSTKDFDTTVESEWEEHDLARLGWALEHEERLVRIVSALLERLVVSCRQRTADAAVEDIHEQLDAIDLVYQRLREAELVLTVSLTSAAFALELEPEPPVGAVVHAAPSEQRSMLTSQHRQLLESVEGLRALEAQARPAVEACGLALPAAPRLSVEL
jgi:hypothetical protein